MAALPQTREGIQVDRKRFYSFNTRLRVLSLFLESSTRETSKHLFVALFSCLCLCHVIAAQTLLFWINACLPTNLWRLFRWVHPSRMHFINILLSEPDAPTDTNDYYLPYLHVEGIWLLTMILSREECLGVQGSIGARYEENILVSLDVLNLISHKKVWRSSNFNLPHTGQLWEYWTPYRCKQHFIRHFLISIRDTKQRIILQEPKASIWKLDYLNLLPLWICTRTGIWACLHMFSVLHKLFNDT